MMRLFLVLAFAATSALAVSAQPNTLRGDSSRTESREAGTRPEASVPVDSLAPAAEPPDSEAASGERSTWLWPAVGGALGLVLILGGGWYVWTRKNAALSPTPGYRGPDNRRTGAQISDQSRQSGASIYASSHDLATLQQRVHGLEQTVQQLGAYVNQMATPVPAPAPASAASASTPAALPPAAGPAEQAAEAFATWCRTRGPLVNKHDLFANDLAATQPGATLDVVYRDVDSFARPIYFDGAGGHSPAPFWLVRSDGETLLFPQPQGPQQFRELSPVFEGHATPQALQHVVPARVSSDGGGFVLTQPGRVA
jgi:hypothetical protein